VAVERDLFQMTFEQVPTSGQRHRLLDLLRQTYRNDWSELRQDFEPAPGVENWQNLNSTGRSFCVPVATASARCAGFSVCWLSVTTHWCMNIIRKYDQRALILGDRYQSFYYPEVAALARPRGRRLQQSQRELERRHLRAILSETLHALSGKPVIIASFYMAAAR